MCASAATSLLAPDPKRQRLPSIVCSGGWESRRTGALAELEAEHGDGTYQEYELP